MIYTTLDKNRDGFINIDEFGNSSMYLKRKSCEFQSNKLTINNAKSNSQILLIFFNIFYQFDRISIDD